MKKLFPLTLLMVLVVGGWLWFGRRATRIPGPSAIPTATQKATNSPAVSELRDATNQAPSAAVEAEIKEISRLSSVAMTNPAVKAEIRARVLKLYVKQHPELKETNDTVGIAIKMAQDPKAWRIVAIEELAQHWENPRAEQTLESISRSGPLELGELGLTFEGKAKYLLIELRARQKLHQITDGKATDQERTAAIIHFLDDRPELVTPNPRPLENAILAEILLKELVSQEDGDAMRMVFRSGHIPPAYAKAHFAEMLEFAKTLKPDEAVEIGPLFERLYESKDKAALPLFEKWLPAVKDRYARSWYEDAIRELRAKDKN